MSPAMFLAMFITNVREDRLKCRRRCFDKDDNVAVDVGGGGSADVSAIGDVAVELRSNSPKVVLCFDFHAKKEKGSFTESLSKTIITTFALPASSEDDSSDHDKDLSGPSEKKSTKVPEMIKTGQASQPKGVGGVEAVEDLVRQIEEFNFEPELAEFFIQKLQFLSNIFVKKSRDIRMAIREDIVNNVIAPIVEKFRNRETLHISTIYDLQARPVGIEERTYQPKIRSCEESIEKLKAQLQLANADLSTLNKDLNATAKGLLESTKEIKAIIKKS
ncbi:hypothetical protein AVEN_140231-1 [Araneus ventricosus]|uniref:Uncharacterized protein n=1 Tax=Araneus ventricosus TaxID=182803 RepID=A0A4Y2I8L3_ARAVE|nr:hypothetical protein AVEN_140231-1 [Araneus ventricosus]